MNNVDEYIKQGKKFESIGDCFSAIRAYEKGLIETGDSIFNLYMGMCYYNKEMMYDAQKHLNIYQTSTNGNLESNNPNSKLCKSLLQEINYNRNIN